MPPLTRGVIAVSRTCRDGKITRLMQRHRYTIQEMDGDACDFACGSVGVIFVDDINRLCNPTQRAVVHKRLSTLTSSVGASWRSAALLVLVTSSDPRPDILTWLNLHCSVELRCSTMLCWTEEECAAYLEGLSESSITSVDYRATMRGERTPIGILVEAFTQTPQLMARNDVVRAAHRFGSVASLLVATAEDFAALPGFGHRKAGRLTAVLNAIFPTSHQLVCDVLHGDVRPNGGDTVTDEKSEDRQGESSARELMLSKLAELMEKEEAGAEE
ncbi:Binding domain [Trypanosoma vivax]|uniref:Putative DNA repair protein n=1 Tax=Trypanosoma vivax (strain Y486) TaxID=1055687 RepID=G0TXZ5_TRYVY|nr:Binding domain [Trypanosoma vivax]CCC48840.1 putative DNA repair protein [Trypanosoma vivax Y486]